MTMTDREKLAREWAEYYQGDWPQFTPGSRAAELVEKAKAAAEYILEHMAPPTMADMEWDDDIHRGLGAVDDAGQEWVILQDDDPYISLIGLDLNPVGAKREELTPNGKRYELREITDVPDHLSELLTETDYLDAPIGTIIVVPGEGTTAVQKLDDNEWGIAGIRTRVDAEACARASADHGPGTVLRWGDEA